MGMLNLFGAEHRERMRQMNDADAQMREVVELLSEVRELNRKMIRDMKEAILAIDDLNERVAALEYSNEPS